MNQPLAPRLPLGRRGPDVFPIGFGCMGLSGMYGPTDDEQSIRTLHAAIDRGVTLFDTGDFYGTGHNELLLGRALRGRRDGVQISVKFGALRGPDGAWLGLDMRPAATKNALAHSLRRLGVEHVDVYRPARLDPAVPIEDTIGAIAEMVKAGYVRHIGLSEVGPETLRRAAAVHPIVDLQIEYSLISRGPEAKVFPTLDALGASATLYGVYSRGLLTGSKPTAESDYRGYLPRFAGDANAALADRIATFARERGRAPAEVLLGWVRAKQPTLVPVVGMKTTAQLDQALAVLERPLSAEDVAALEALVPANAAVGERYDAHQMRALDSER